MKIVSLKYERKFGGARGSAIEEYGSELLGIDIVPSEDEEISFDDVQKLFIEASRKVFIASTKGQVAAKAKKEGAS